MLKQIYNTTFPIEPLFERHRIFLTPIPKTNCTDNNKKTMGNFTATHCTF